MSDSDENYCRRCDAPASFTCTACKKAKYCGKKCQDRDWCLHIFDCNTDKPIKTFHHLARAIFKDLLPTDGRTLEDWGFRRAEACPEHAPPGPVLLFGVYVGLVNHHEIEPKILDQWRRKGILLQEIKRIYEAIPETYRGGYYPWLLKNHFILDLSQPMPSASLATAERMAHRAWAFSKGAPNLSVDEILKIGQSWGTRKYECFMLCGMVLERGRPGPNGFEDMWVHYGFCIGGLYEEMQVAGLYISLLNNTSFQEFFDTFENSGIIALVKKKMSWPMGFVGGDETLAKEFEDVMSDSGRGVYKSVWWLKAFVQRQVELVKPDFEMHPSVRVDYGFYNCRNDTERRTLLGLYRLYFDFENPKPRPLDLHEACIKGKLFEHLNAFPRVKLREEHRRLLRNLYPLVIPD